MNERIKRLRERCLQARPRISSERAELLTEFFSDPKIRGLAPPVLRGMAFRHIMENKSLFLGEEELIVGERGPEPRATPTYPEICIHSLGDLEILNSRQKVSFAVDEDTRRVYENKIIPFWNGLSVRDKMFRELPREWKDAYEAGVFTEFQEQRAPGHTAGGSRIFSAGFSDYLAEIRSGIQKLDFAKDPNARARRNELQGMEHAAIGLVQLGKRYATLLKEKASRAKNPRRRRELEEMAQICSRVPEHAPRTFREALQHYWFVHIGVITEFNTWDSFNPGRLDQHLWPFYNRDIESGRLSREDAKELLSAFWIKFNNQPAPPQGGRNGPGKQHLHGFLPD